MIGELGNALPFTVVDLDPDDRPAWLGWRRSGIGASDAAALLGVSPWASPLSVYSDKTATDPPDDDDDREFLRWGRLLEDPILDEFERRTGRLVSDRQLCAQSTSDPHMLSTLDGIVYTDRNGRPTPVGVAEVKVTGDRPWDDPPIHYQAQVAWQLAVTGLRRGWLISLHNARELVIHQIDVDDQVTADLRQVAAEFWARVVDRRPPPADGHTATTDALTRMFPGNPDAEPVVVPEDLALEVAAARDAAKVADEAKRAAENALKQVIGDATEAVVAAGDGTTATVATWRPHTQTEWNVDALIRAAGINPNDPHVQHYRRTSPRRPLRIT